MKEEWTYKSFEECLLKAAMAKQVQTSDYNSGSQYPIISQEDKMISGYCDDASLLYHIDTPIVIFGDHTRVLKYVDFDFVVGADGVKILIPKDFLKAKYLFYYLRWYNVPSLGYSRHYKLLKEITLPIPPLSVQQSIVSELDMLSGLIAKHEEQLKAYDELAQSIFYDMFGDPVENEKGWEVKKLGEVCELKAGKAIKADELSNENIYPCFGGNGIRGFINRYSHEGEYPIIGRQGALCGNVNFAKGKFYATEHAVVVSPLCEMNAMWLFYSLIQLDLGQYAHGVAQPGLSVKDLEPINMLLPPLPLQTLFAEKIEAIERQKERIRQSMAEVKTLFDSRMDYYFNSDTPLL
ncbi:MAG: restriction endonuclease subunit S [Bacteroidaceae bacterium]|nr:restriction endonuclease subunit S [Bacteroidaceae bacterium]